MSDTATQTALSQSLLALLRREEGEKLTVYDDATGKPLQPGMALIGHPTIGVGRALDTNGITLAESGTLLANDVAGLLARLPIALPFWDSQSIARQQVLAAMAFQMGVPGLLAFKATLAAVARGDYGGAATQMLASKWAQQTPARAQRMAAMMRSGLIG